MNSPFPFSPRPAWLPWLGLGVVLGIFFFLKQLYAHISFFMVDEAVSAVVGQAIQDGGLPYKDAVDHRGPLTYFFYAGIFQIWGSWNMYAVHQVYIWLQMGLIFLAFGVGWQWKNRVAGVWAAAFLAFCIYASPFHEVWPAHTEWLLTFFAGIGYLLYLLAPGSVGQRSAKRFSMLLLSGLCFGLGALSKQTGILEVGGIGLYLLLELGVRQGKWKALWGEIGIMFLGFLIPIAILLIRYASRDALEDLWLFGWHYNAAYYVPATSWALRIEESVKMLMFFFWNKVLIVSLLVSSFWLLPWRSLRMRNEPLPLVWMLVGWLAMSLIEALIGGRHFNHYLIPAFLPLSLLCGYRLIRIKELLEPRQTLMQAGGVGVILMLVLPGIHHWSLTSFLLPEDASTQAYAEVAAYIQTNTQPDERIFVWGFSPEIYVQAQRRPASRFNYYNMLVGHVPAVTYEWEKTDHLILPGSWERLWEDLAAHPPVFIIEDTYRERLTTKYAAELFPFGQWREQYYECDTTFFHPDYGFPQEVWRRRR